MFYLLEDGGQINILERLSGIQVLLQYTALILNVKVVFIFNLISPKIEGKLIYVALTYINVKMIQR